MKVSYECFIILKDNKHFKEKNHPFNFNFIFLSDGTTVAAERAACFADLYRR
jgi:hypothetical protein